MNVPEPPSNQEIILHPIQKDEGQNVTFFGLFRFAKKNDIIYICLGSACSMLIGGALPIFSMLWGDLTNAFRDTNEMVDRAFTILIEYIIFGVASIFAGWGMQYFWTVAGQNQANQCRRQFLTSLLKQEIGWFQTQNSSEIISKFMSDSLSFQLAIGQKVSLMIYILSMFVTGVVIAILKGWELALVVLAFMPILVFSWWLMELFARTRSEHEDKIFQSASGVAQEVLSSIKIVKQFNGQEHEIKRFQSLVRQLKQKSHQHNIKFALSQFFCLLCLTFAFLLTFWYGSQCVQSTSSCPQRSPNPYNGGTVLTIFFSLILPAINLNQLAPSFKIIMDGKIAAKRLFKVINRQSQIQSPQNPTLIQSLNGIFEFKDVTFAYPKDKSRNILSNFSLRIDCKHAGIMGKSGCGKSTLLQMMIRLYDPDSGVVMLDGVDIRKLDLQWLRKQIGYVSQEPLLFSTSIRDNLLIGKVNASKKEMMQALRQAQILQFVTELSEGIQTYVGSGGSQLSGGQKQRIAIARALLKNPHILLLDEATSALDLRNQRHIQLTLSKIAAQNISITVAHRLKTIVNCDQIFIIQKEGKVKVGKPNELQGYRNQLMDTQIIKQTDKKQIQKVVNQKNIKVEIQNNYQHSCSKLHQLFYTKTILKTEQNLNASNIPKDDGPKQVNDTYSRLISYTSGNTLMIILGLLCSSIHGLVIPSMGIHVARIESYDLMYPSNPSYYSQQIKLSCLYMIITCIVGPIALGFQFFIFHYLGSNIVNRIRFEVYNKVVRLPLAWFEKADNHPEQMSVKLGADIYTINHVISRYFSHLCVAISSVAFGLILAFFFEWRTALISIVMIPLIGLTGVIQAKMLQGYLTESRKLNEQSLQIITDGIINIKTVLSFCYQQQIIKNYSLALEDIQQKQFNKKVTTGFIFGVSYFILFVVNGIIFYLAALFIRDNNLEITNAFSAVFLVLFSGMIAGNNIKSVPDLGLLKVTAEKLFDIIDLQDEDQLQIKKGSKLIDQKIKGNIQFRNVYFKYQNREEIALKNVSFQVREGEKIGIVGSSGCGKSTILKLLLGFYNYQEGKIIIDGHAIQDYDVHCLRENFGTIQQEPQLFDESIEYNIAYNQKNINRQMIEEAAYKSQLEINPMLFQREVGPRGSHLSGGEKQRVAIARVILRNPSILLLDQPTSALDKQNGEKIEQCLDAVIKGRTALFVTHKLQTIQNASQILILDEGQVVERGVYIDLINQKGYFYRLLNGLQIK